MSKNYEGNVTVINENFRTGGPLVTAIAVSYNHSRFVIECLESIHNQTYPYIDLIILDDCSTDDSPAKIEEWIRAKAVPCRFIRHRRNEGVCRSLNEALRLAKGKYVSMVATDDTWEPEKIRSQVEIMEGLHDGVGVVYSDAHQMDETGKLLSERFIGQFCRFDRPPDGDVHNNLWEGNFIPAMTTLIRRSCFESVGFFDETLFYEDWDMWLRISERFHFAYSDRISARYRIVSTSMLRSSFPEIMDSDVRMIRKWLSRTDVSPRTRKLMTKILAIRAISSYLHGSKYCHQNLWLACRFEPSSSVVSALACNWAGIPPARYIALRQVYRGLLGRNGEG